MSSPVAVAAPTVASPSVSAPVVWRIVAARTLRVLRSCPRCARITPFASSDRFRVNASGRRLDVWLVYRCTACDFTWNLTIAERSTPEAIGAAALSAYHRNDRELAWRCAFDLERLRRAKARPEPTVPFMVERPPIPEGPFTIRFEVPFPIGIRLDRLLARELGIPRSSLAGRIAGAEPRRPVRDGLLVTIGPRHRDPAGP